MRPSSSSTFVLLAGFAAVLGMQEPAPAPSAPQAGFTGLARPAPVPDGRIAKLADLGDYACAQCHLEVADEWAASMHALAWADPIYQEEIEGKKRPEACHGCHIPKPLHQGELGAKPAARADSKEDPWSHGISCESCHLGAGGAILGPWGEPTTAHASQRAESMTAAGSTELCLSCHKVNIGPVIGIAKDFESSNQAGRGRSCVGCHWASVERTWSNAPAAQGATPASSPTKPRPGRSHATQTPRDPAFLKRAFAAACEVKDGKTTIVLENATGHRVPGLIGRSFAFTASVLDANGKVLAEKQQTFDTRAHLPVDQAVRIVVDAAGAEVRLVGVHHDPRLEKPVTFLDVKLAPKAQ